MLVGSVLLGLGIGYSIDANYDSDPLWTVIMFFVFMVIGMYHLIKNS